MRRFRFRFETVLSVRKNLENEALKAMSAAQRAFVREIARKEKLIDQLRETYMRVEKLGESGERLNGTQAFYLERAFIEGTKVRIIQVDHSIQRAAKAVERAKKAYLAARRSTRTIEVLKEREWEEFKRQQNKREQKEMDDMMLMRERLKGEALIEPSSEAQEEIA